MKEKQMDCKHGPGEKCIYCLPPLLHTYTVNMNCPKHMPYPRGLCSSCAPEACILQRQPYRHVDHIEFSDRRYFDLFCNAYIEHDYKPMMGFLYVVCPVLDSVGMANTSNTNIMAIPRSKPAFIAYIFPTRTLCRVSTCS